MSLIKSEADQKLLRHAGHILGQVIAQASHKAASGVTLLELDTFIDQAIRAADCRPSFLGHEGFPNASCLSVNEQVVHGIPSDRVLQDGDILGIDVGLWYEHVCVDGAETVAIGNIDSESARLLQVTKEALLAGIKAAKPFRRIGQISHAVQTVAESAELGIVRALVGHGVGHAVWESPQVPNYGYPHDGSLLKPGMVIAIEPMLTLGGGDVETEVDGWTIVTADNSRSAQFEHTVLITAKGPEILTRA